MPDARDAPEGTGSAPATVVETHISTVVFVEDRAYKLKRPVDLGFVDQTTRARREAACHREVELNRRLAPDVYLGVADVRGPDGEVCDHLVVMRRLDPRTRLSALAAEGVDLEPALRSVAHQVAALHAASPPAGDRTRVGRLDERVRLWRECIEVVRTVADRLPAGLVPDIEDLAGRYLRGRQPLWDERIGAGRIVEGHGDLRAEDVFWDGTEARILDCIDFDDDLLWGDGLLDVAFLAMDLLDAGRPDDATALLDLYGELAADTWPPSLAHHFIAYRALVRAKVSALRAAQGDRDALDVARRMAELSHAELVQGRVRLVLVGGAPGSGKTSLARALGEALSAVVVSSDEVRDEIDPRVGPGPTAPDAPGEGRYFPERRKAVYDEALARAATLLGRGHPVVLDASWSEVARRRAARRVASATVSDLVEIRCTAPDAERERRIAARAARGGDASEATVEAARHLASGADPWPEATTVATLDAPEVLAERIARDLTST